MKTILLPKQKESVMQLFHHKELHIFSYIDKYAFDDNCKLLKTTIIQF